MKTALETRLQKLETVHGKQDAGVFVIEGSTEDERQASIKALIASGKAVAPDTFVYTGVPRQAAGSPPACTEPGLRHPSTSTGRLEGPP